MSHLSFTGQSLLKPVAVRLLIAPASQNCFLRGQGLFFTKSKVFSSLQDLRLLISAFSWNSLSQAVFLSPIMHHLSLTWILVFLSLWLPRLNAFFLFAFPLQSFKLFLCKSCMFSTIKLHFNTDLIPNLWLGKALFRAIHFKTNKQELVCNMSNGLAS